MQKLSEICWQNLCPGDKVISAKGTPGIITSLIPKIDSARYEDDEVVIIWETGKSSWDWMYHLLGVSYVGHQSNYPAMSELSRTPEIGQVFSQEIIKGTSIQLWKVVDNSIVIEDKEGYYCLLKLLDECHEKYLVVDPTKTVHLKLISFPERV